MINCKDCKYAIIVEEHEYECTAEQYDIDDKSCYVPRTVDEAYCDAFKAVNKISRNSEQMGELLTKWQRRGNGKYREKRAMDMCR